MTESTTIIRNTEKYLAKKFDNGKYGFVDQRGRKVIEPKFDYAYDFKGGFAIIKNGKDYGIIDETGKIVETKLPGSINK